jgi:hypothetical protein
MRADVLLQVIRPDIEGSTYSWIARKVAISYTPTASMLDISSLHAMPNLTKDESNTVIVRQTVHFMDDGS